MQNGADQQRATPGEVSVQSHLLTYAIGSLKLPRMLGCVCSACCGGARGVAGGERRLPVGGVLGDQAATAWLVLLV